ncbi:NAD(+) synthase [Prevotella melaninogenica]|uniref:NAD(+) synthase n=1 Tax=Prevotella TaxID=838 RepID=UPI0003AD13BE|nr:MULTISPECIES: NAD(+) synthase [Prevotella]ERJ78276.1 NAD+ synthase [Prevotella sp. F0091]QUB73562.1 NAD(+) synthase [Prevotella melaninogenica]
MKHGLIKVASAIPALKVADTKFNLIETEKQIVSAEGQGVEIIVFPELSITGYTCQDLFQQQLLLDDAEQAVLELLDFTRQLDITVIVGAPIAVGALLLNCAVVIQQGKLLGIVAKTFLPNYSEFYEKRWFASSQDLRPQHIHFAGTRILVTPELQIFRTSEGATFAIEICEDVWAPTPPSNHLALAGAEIIFNLSASDELAGKHTYLKSLLAQQSARTICGYVYSSSGFGESTQDIVFGGNALIYENGTLIKQGERFKIDPQLIVSEIDIENLRGERRTNSTFVNAQRPVATGLAGVTGQIGELALHVECMPPLNAHEFTLTRAFDQHPFIPRDENMQDACDEIFNIQINGLAKRLVHTNCKTAVIGISGGLDSTLALLVAVKTFDKLGLNRKGIVGVTMPGFGTTGRTYKNAMALMEHLGITIREIDIKDSVLQHFKDINHDPAIHDATYENAQARERTQILMDLSNQLNGLVIGTGDLSELALGWCTYNGDHMSMYAVNAGVPKTLTQYLVRYAADRTKDENVRRTLTDIVETPISPELKPADDKGNIAQKTEDLVGPYELHDFFLYYVLRCGFRPSKIYWMAQNAFRGVYSDETILHWMRLFFRRFFAQQFKRSCLPDGPKVGSVSLSPRGDWRMPSDAMSTNWLNELEGLS